MAVLVDLTRTLTARALSYPGDRPAIAFGRADPRDSGSRVCWLAHLDLHAGTHMDAPRHFVPGGADVASVPPQLLPALVVRCRVERILADALPAGILRGCAILFDTGWTYDAEVPAYFQGYPHLSHDVARELVARGVALVGIDTPSVDSAEGAGDYPAHHALLEAGIPIVEGLWGLDRLPGGPGRVQFAVLPLKLDEADGELGEAFYQEYLVPILEAPLPEAPTPRSIVLLATSSFPVGMRFTLYGVPFPVLTAPGYLRGVTPRHRDAVPRLLAPFGLHAAPFDAPSPCRAEEEEDLPPGLVPALDEWRLTDLLDYLPRSLGALAHKEALRRGESVCGRQEKP